MTDGQQLLVDLVDRDGGIHPTQEPLLLIILYERAGLMVKHLDADQRRSGLNSDTLHQRSAALVADPLPFGRIMLDVIDRLARGATAAPREAADDLLMRHLEADHMIEPRGAGLFEHPVQRFGLRHCPGKPIEDIPSHARWARQFFPDESDDHLILHELARVHVALRPQPDRRAALDGLPQDFSGRDLGDLLLLSQALRLRPLAHAGRSQKDQAHRLTRFVLSAVPWPGTPHRWACGCATSVVAPCPSPRRR